jgi:hypothetical protein
MSIGEDIPMLIPTSIVLVTFILFVMSLFGSFSEKFDAARMSQASLTTGDYLVNVRFSTGTGELDLDGLGNDFTFCRDIAQINITSNYQLAINISDASGRYWCWDNTNSFSREPRTQITNILPVLLSNSTDTINGQVKISVGK